MHRLIGPTSGTSADGPLRQMRGLFRRRRWYVCVLMFLSWLAAPALGQPKEPDESNKFVRWSETGFERAHSRVLRPEELYGKRPPSLDYSLGFTAVFLEGTGWREARVIRQIRKTARIFEPCGIELRDVRLVRAHVPQELRNIDVNDKVPGSDVPRDVYRLVRLLPGSAKWPVVFFIGNIRGEEVLARSYQQGNVPATELRDYPYMNSAWISYRAHWLERPEDDYSALAHEVAHLLCRCGHERGPQRHLLHEYRNFLGAHVLGAHCEQFRSSNLVTRPARLDPQ
jgi:hypothetical protein